MVPSTCILEICLCSARERLDLDESWSGPTSGRSSRIGKKGTLFRDELRQVATKDLVANLGGGEGGVRRRWEQRRKGSRWLIAGL